MAGVCGTLQIRCRVTSITVTTSRYVGHDPGVTYASPVSATKPARNNSDVTQTVSDHSRISSSTDTPEASFALSLPAIPSRYAFLSVLHHCQHVTCHKAEPCYFRYPVLLDTRFVIITKAVLPLFVRIQE